MYNLTLNKTFNNLQNIEKLKSKTTNSENSILSNNKVSNNSSLYLLGNYNKPLLTKNKKEVAFGFEPFSITYLAWLAYEHRKEIADSCKDMLEWAGLKQDKAESNNIYVSSNTITKPKEDFTPEEINKLKEAYSSQITSKKGFNKLAGYTGVKMSLMENVTNNILLNKEDNILNAILLYGPKGNGKTEMARAIGETCSSKCNFEEFELDPFDRKEEIKALGKIIKTAKEEFKNTGKRTIIFIDEFDALVNPKCEENVDMIGYFKSNLSQMAKKGITFIFATNYPQKIEDTIMRNERIDLMVAINPPDKDDTKEIFNHYLAPAGKLISKDLNFDKIAEESTNKVNASYNCADIKTIANEVIKNVKTEKVTTNDVLTAINKRPPSLKGSDIIEYEDNLKFFQQNYSSMKNLDSRNKN